MDLLGVILLFLHVAGGAVWLGASVFVNVVALPATLAQPPDRRTETARLLLLAPERLIIAAAVTAAMMGIALGITGRISSIDALSTPCGMVWLLAIGITVGVFGVGGAVTSPAMRAFIGSPPGGAGNPHWRRSSSAASDWGSPSKRSASRRSSS